MTHSRPSTPFLIIKCGTSSFSSLSYLPLLSTVFFSYAHFFSIHPFPPDPLNQSSLPLTPLLSCSTATPPSSLHICACIFPLFHRSGDPTPLTSSCTLLLLIIPTISFLYYSPLFLLPCPLLLSTPHSPILFIPSLFSSPYIYPSILYPLVLQLTPPHIPHNSPYLANFATAKPFTFTPYLINPFSSFLFASLLSALLSSIIIPLPLKNIIVFNG